MDLRIAGRHARPSLETRPPRRRLWLATFGLLLVGLGLPAAQALEPTAVRLPGTDRSLVPALEAAGYDVAGVTARGVELLASPRDLERLATQGWTWEALERDLFPGARGDQREGNLDPEYHTYAEMRAELEALAATYPQICAFYDVGDALSRHYWWTNYDQEYDLWAVRISDHPDQDEAEPCIVYDGRHHAREPVSTEIVLAVARHFCENYGGDPVVTTLVNESEIWCVPMVNPDGHQWVEDVDPWWRKTLWDHDEDHLVDTNEGIDPNRNYDWHWDGGDWSSQTYGGPYAWSAHEVASMRDLQLAQRPAINPSYHSYGEVVLYPFGYGVQPEPVVTAIAGEYASRVGYSSQQSTTANGSSKDWVYGRTGGVSFTVETATTFIPTGAQMEAEVAQLLPGSIWLAERLHGASVRGTVTDAQIGIPLAATIHIPEVHEVYGGGELYDIETEAATGFFCRMRPEAVSTITLVVSADGYVTQEIPVTTGGTTPTEVAIELEPSDPQQGVLAGTVTNATTGGTPLREATVSVLPGGPTFVTGADGGFIGYVAPGSYTVRASHASFAPDSLVAVPIEIGETTEVDFALTDIVPPAISGTTELASTSDPTGPYPVETEIADASGLAEATLRYRVGGGGFIDLTLTPQGGDGYTAAIPGQPYDSYVEYYVLARDPGANQATDPPAAPAELYAFQVAQETTLFADAFESGAPGWTHAVVTPGFVDQWHLSGARNHTAGGATSWKCGASGAGEYAGLLDAGLETPEIELALQSQLTFWHWIDAEESGAYPGQAYDGGLLEIAVDGGPWVQLTPAGGYSHVCRAGGTPGPFPAGTPIFSGTHDWELVTVDLGAYSGSARFRFRFGSDGAAGGEGWYIDDVELTGLGAPSRVAGGDPTLTRAAVAAGPNPLVGGAETTIRYRLPAAAQPTLDIIDPSGRRLRRITSAAQAAHGTLQWDGRDDDGRRVAPGLYLLRLSGAGETATGKLIVID